MTEINVHRSPIDDTTVLSAKINMTDIMSAQGAHILLVEILRAIAQRFVEEHYAEIAAKLDQQAIANLAIAEAAKKIAEEIQRQPNIVHEVEHHTAVYQRGIFGGMRRVG